MWVTIFVGVLTFVLSSLSSLTGDWETGRFNFLPLWAGVALGYGYTSLVVAKLKNELWKKTNHFSRPGLSCAAGQDPAI
jgi:hypothetical protein